MPNLAERLASDACLSLTVVGVVRPNLVGSISAGNSAGGNDEGGVKVELGGRKCPDGFFEQEELETWEQATPLLQKGSVETVTLEIDEEKKNV
ncbi:hypothetical protein NL676_020373 [Syzygium grande]|nr:hypothetical protein NL676_020373 [Syzygium grande]